MLEHFRNRQVNGAEVSLAVSGLENFTAAKDFKRSIETLKGIKEAEQKDFSKGKAMLPRHLPRHAGAARRGHGGA